jgi:hypothetical protein
MYFSISLDCSFPVFFIIIYLATNLSNIH